MQAVTVVEVKDDDPEITKDISTMSTKVETVDTVLGVLEKRISRWSKMVRVVVYVHRFIAKCKRFEVPLSIETSELIKAENKLVSLIQQRAYSNEISTYKTLQPKSNKRKAKTRLWRLNPLLDENGILRVGGRLGRTDFSSETKHPAILPYDAIATRRIAESCHLAVEHSGRTTTVGEIRQSGYWIVNVNSCVRSIINRCVPCRLFRGRMGEQKMADLPEGRFSCEGPFVYAGVDICGPFMIKEKRSEVKRYVALFTCMASRAIHLESTKDMSADSFILALRRFLARRGFVKSIKSDNGTNFVGAEAELRKGWDEMDHRKVSDFLLSKKCDWISWERNPPCASHMGGVWERQIRSVRNIMCSLLHNHPSKLDDESLRTFLCETECIVNSRPLTTDNLSDPSCDVLTPNHILTMKPRVVLSPPGAFKREDIYCRKRWRAIQFLANQFWKRWRSEYLLNLQQRNKWVAPRRNFQVDDIVLIKDDDVARNCWPLGRVSEVEKNEHDGLVRSVSVYSATSGSVLRRPIHKLVLLVGVDEDFS